MSNEIAVGDAEPTTETTAPQSNMSAADFVNRRLGQLNEQAQKENPNVEATNEVVEETEVESNEEETNEEVVAEQSQESEDSDDVLSQLDLDDMSEDDLRELSEKLGSRAVARFGELTAKRKAAEEKLKTIEAQLRTKNPLETQEVANNPYESINSLRGLQNKAKEVSEVIEWAEEMLFNADGYGPEDIVTEVEGQQLSKSEVRTSLLNARKARDKFLPAQLKTLQAEAQSVKLKNAYDAQAKKELSWLEGENNDVRTVYESMINDPRLSKIKKTADPEIKAQLDYLVAHAANSIHGRKLIKNSPKSATLSPPRTSAPSASKSEKTVGKSVKALKNFNQQFRQSGNKSDFIALRTLQLKNKQS